MTKLRPLLAFTGLGLAILGPLLLPGYILALDMTWTPQIPWRPELTNLYPLHWLLYELGRVLPSMLIQKLLLLVILVLAGLGAYRLMAGRVSGSAAWLAGLVYVINPWVYTRLMAGQYLVLAGYALLPWLVAALWRLLERPGARRAAVVGAWSVVIGLVSIHMLGFVAFITLVSLAAWGWGRWREWGRPIAWLLGVAAGWLVANGFWLMAGLGGRGSGVGAQVASFGWDQFKAYASTPGGVGVPLNTLVLQGFWNDPHGRYVLPSATGILFWTACAVVAGLVIAGLSRSLVRRDRLGIALGMAGLIAWILGMGIAWAPGSGLTHWLVTHVPLYQGYREPQKWLALLALAYAYLAAVGLGWLQDRLRGWGREVAVAVALVAPLAWTPMLLWGAGGQLRSVDYPASWYQLRSRLAAEQHTDRVLVLPWHQYLALDFAGQTVASPATAFWGPRTVVSQDPELLGVQVTQNQPIDNLIAGQVLAGAYYDHDAGAKLAPAGIGEVVLLKQGDWQTYSWLDNQTDLKLRADTSGWKLYTVEAAK